MPEIQDVIDIANHMMWITVLLSMPTLLTSLVVGLLISLVQTVTGVQEMTITFVPKLFAVLLALSLSLSWSNSILMEYTQEIIEIMGRAW
jgi:flagellar biosynthesis protein FliQ